MAAKGLKKVDPTVAMFTGLSPTRIFHVRVGTRAFTRYQHSTHGPTGNIRKDAKSVEKIITKTVEKMFKQYPYPLTGSRS